MTLGKIKNQWFAGAFFIVLFAVLFSVRLGLFQKASSNDSSLRAANAKALIDKEAWMNIVQNGQKIGYSHRKIEQSPEGYTFTETVFMRINTMGVVQPIRIKTDGYLQPDMSLASFIFSLQSSIFNFRLRGVVKDKTVTIYSGPWGRESKTEITLSEKPHLANGILDTALQNDLKPGQSKTLHIFDPAVMAERPATISYQARERIQTPNGAVKAKKYSLDFLGVKQFAWIDDNGDVIREQGMLGITLEKVTSREALTGFSSSSSDLTEIASIPLDQNIQRPFELKELRVKLTHVDKNLFLNGDRQFYQNGILTIRKESLANRAPEDEKSVIALKPFLEATPLIQSDHPDIINQVQRIISPSDSETVKANKLIQWIYRHIEKRPVLSLPNALDTLRNRVGDCNEHAALTAAMARAAGIPAQIEAGLVYQRGRFYYHAWNVLYLGKCVTADAVFGQLPADVTHIRLVRGSEDKQIDLLGTIGKLQIHIEDYR